MDREKMANRGHEDEKTYYLDYFPKSSGGQESISIPIDSSTDKWSFAHFRNGFVRTLLLETGAFTGFPNLFHALADLVRARLIHVVVHVLSIKAEKVSEGNVFG